MHFTSEYNLGENIQENLFSQSEWLMYKFTLRMGMYKKH